MGRLEDIALRNKKPKTRFRKAPAAPRPQTKEVNQGEGDEKGRLDQIIARNQHPNSNYRWLKVGLGGLVLFVVLILLIFTDLANPPEDPQPAPVVKEPGGGVKLWKAPKQSGSARP